MTDIFIGGKLGKKIGSTWKLKVSTFMELFNALECNTGTFRHYLNKNKKDKLAIFLDGDLVKADDFLYRDVKNKKIEIVPILAGAAAMMAGAIVSAIGLQGVAAVVVQFVLTAVISAAISFGISYLISKIMKSNDPDATSTTSFVFSSAENTAQQGQVVPVGYGRMSVGGNVVSVSLSSVEKNVWDRKSVYPDRSAGAEGAGAVVYRDQN
jgi:predicted phage tail protein